MGFGDFQLNNNGKKEQLRDVKQGVRKEQLDKKYHALFDAYDVNKDGTLEAEELNGILKGLQSFAGADKVLDSNENLQAKSIFANEANIQDADFQGFVKSLSDTSDDTNSNDSNENLVEVKQVGNKEITITNGRISKIVVDLGNGETETTNYEYIEATEACTAHVNLLTTKGENENSLTVVLDIDENGGYSDNQFIYRTKTAFENGKLTLITISKENGRIIEKKKKEDKTVVNIYNESSITEFDKNETNKLFQQVQYDKKAYNVFYDGNGNTYIPIKNGESVNVFLARVNKQLKKLGQSTLTINDLKKLNPNTDLNNLKVASHYTDDTGTLLIPGTYNADSSLVFNSGTTTANAQAQANDMMKKAAERVNNKNIRNQTLTKAYKSYNALAKEIGVNVNELMILNQSKASKNGLVELRKGVTIRVPVELTPSDTPEAIKRAFPLNGSNRIFYQRYNSLNPDQKQHVLSTVRSMHGKSEKEIKDEILKNFPDINLFDSGKLIQMGSSFGTPSYLRKQPVALETFLTDTLKLDLKSEVGRLVYERLASLPQEELNKIDGRSFVLMSNATFVDIANQLESCGINIRTQMEKQVEQNKRVQRAERLGIPQQKFTSEMLANIYDRAADMLEQYYHNHGVFDAGTYIEGMKNLMDLVTPNNIFGIEMRSTLHIASECRKAARRFREMHTDDPKTFEREYKELKKDGLVKADYNRQNVQEFMNLIQSGEVDINSDKFKKACQKAFGYKGVENTEQYIQTGEMAGNLGDIVVMLYTLGAASELKMMGKVTTGVYGALERGAGKFMGKTAAQKTAKVGTSMLMGGTTLGEFTLGKETLNNLSNPMRDATSWETWKQTGIAGAESFGFGLAGGLLNETVVAPIVKAIEKPATKATQAVSKALTEQGELTGKHIMETVSESGSLKLDGLFKMNSQELKNLVRTATANGVGFGVEVAGFTAYETGLDIIKNLINPNTGRLPDDITVEGLVNYLGDKFREQFENLGTIKGVSMLLMMSKGGKVAQKAMMNDFLSKSETLKNIKLKKAVIDGHEFYEVTYPNGNRAAVSSLEQVIATCQIAVQIEFLAKLQETAENKGEVKVGESTQTEYRNSQESAILSRLETASNRESFVAIRNEITKMPDGKEKTELMKEYLKKYNEWSASPERPGIRMQYVSKAKNISQQITFAETLKQSKSVLRSEDIKLINKLRQRIYTKGLLKTEFTKISDLVNKIDSILSEYVNATNFNTRLEQGKQVLSEIRNSSLSNEEKQVWETVLATKLLPKTDTHFHTKGAMSKECLLQLMKKHHASEKEVKETLQVFEDGAKGFTDLSSFCSAYGNISRWVKDADDIALMTYDNVMQAAKNNIGYLELRNATVGVANMAPKEVLNAMIAGINKAKAELGNDAPTVTITVGAYRGIHPKSAIKPWDFGKKFIETLENKLGKNEVQKAIGTADGKNIYLEDVIEDLIMKLDDSDPAKASLFDDFDNVIRNTDTTGKIFRELKPIIKSAVVDDYLKKYETPIKALHKIAEDYPELDKQFNIKARTIQIYNDAVEITRREIRETMQFVVDNADKEEYDGILTGVDLNGPESHSSAGDWKNEYKLITEYNKTHPDKPIGVTIHAGETFDSSSLIVDNGIATDSNPIYSIESLKSAIEDCGANRIGHGLQLEEFPEFIDWLKLEHPEVTVEINATCNIMSIPAGCEGMNIHPVDILANKGISTVICSDDPAICATNTSLESAKLALMNYNISGNSRGLEGVAKASIEGVRTGFVSEPQKSATIEKFKHQIDAVMDLFQQ